MIRIDLGKNELNKAPPKSFRAVLAKLRLPPKLLAYVQKIQFSASLLIITAAAGTLSALLPIFANQYEITFVNQHQEVMKSGQQKLAKVVDQVTRYSPFQRELQSYQEQKKVVTDRLSVVRKLLEIRSTPVNVLDTIGQSLPGRTWLTTIDVDLGDNASLSLAGESYTNEEISDLIDNLSKSIYLSNVILDGVSTHTAEKTAFRTFNITAKPRVKNEVPGSPSRPTSPPPADNRAIANTATPATAAPAGTPAGTAPAGSPVKAGLPPGGGK